jgi:hypothetical protein
LWEYHIAAVVESREGGETAREKERGREGEEID